MLAGSAFRRSRPGSRHRGHSALLVARGDEAAPPRTAHAERLLHWSGDDVGAVVARRPEEMPSLSDDADNGLRITARAMR